MSTWYAGWLAGRCEHRDGRGRCRNQARWWVFPEMWDTIPGRVSWTLSSCYWAKCDKHRCGAAE